MTALVTGRWAKKRIGLEVRTMMIPYDDDSQEESDTSAMSGASSERRRLDSNREELREAGGWPPEAALRMAARKFGPEENDQDDGDCSPNPSWSAISSTKSPRRPRIAPTQPALVPPLRRQGRGLIHIFDLFAMLL